MVRVGVRFRTLRVSARVMIRTKVVGRSNLDEKMLLSKMLFFFCMTTIYCARRPSDAFAAVFF